ncbi:MAG TPA: TetR/AcrR family transcriptional regulator [Gammaproteobacteria bacterium]|jgi:TetR/AcrR family transcriptional repressor of nem operon|nr:TetR/AcrR family transcriptional regulator [Gammaproteobacteria bacterium]
MPRAKLFNKDEALNKAMELFWKKGYHATSMQDLVTHLSINRASLYDTFGGKQNLFDQSLKLYCDTNRDGTIKFLRSQKRVKEGFLKLFENAISKSTTDPDQKGCFVVNSTTELIPGEEHIKESLISNRAFFEGVFYEFLLSGQKNGEISKDKDIKSIASLIYTLLNGINVIAKIEPDQKKLLSSIRTALSLLD